MSATLVAEIWRRPAVGYLPPVVTSPVIPVLDSFGFQPRLHKQCVLGGGTVIGGPIYLLAFQRLGLTPSHVLSAGVIPGPVNQDWRKLWKHKIYTRSIESRERFRKVGSFLDGYGRSGYFQQTALSHRFAARPTARSASGGFTELIRISTPMAASYLI